MGKNILHIIPYDGIGGVESAARSLPAGKHGDLVFAKHFLVRRTNTPDTPVETHGPGGAQDRPENYRVLLNLIRRSQPDLVIASLWRSVLGILLVKLMRPRQPVVVFLHLSHHVHVIDWLVNWLGMWLATEIWADSHATLNRRVPRLIRNRGRVISFVLTHSDLPLAKTVAPLFVFWGRLNKQKGLERSFQIFNNIRVRHPAAKLRLIGPDGGEEARLRHLAHELGLTDCVSFEGPMSHAQIRCAAEEAAFFLQTSRDEGMSLSVVEAMQTGLVPVVTPVGEIARYCIHKQNAIVVLDDEKVVVDIDAVLTDQEAYRAMSRAAAVYWLDHPLYRDDVLASCRRLLEGR
ncbi:MAG: glycosyltransferase family 4 protein [Roseovarius sp.]